jgi:hypothetical protein
VGLREVTTDTTDPMVVGKFDEKETKGDIVSLPISPVGVRMILSP